MAWFPRVTVVSSRDGQGPAPQRRSRRSARSSGRHLGDPRRGVVQDHRLQAGRDEDPRDAQPGRRARALRAGDGPARRRQDDRAEGRRGRRGGGDEGAREAPRTGAGRRGRVPSAAGRRPEDRGPDLERARDHDARRAPDGGRGGPAARPLRPRPEERGEDPQVARGGSGEPTRETAASSAPGSPPCARVVEELAAHPAAIAVSEAGSVRRRRETVRDLDVIATSKDAPALIAAFCEGDWVSEVVARGDTKATVVGHQGLRFDLRVVPHECYGNVLQHFTGSKDHNIALREEAQRRGLSISEYGVTIEETDEVVHARHRRGALRVPRLPVRSRRSSARAAVELAAARKGELPQLVELGDLRGEMHCHSTLVVRRQELDRGDGDDGARAAGTGSSASPTTRTTCATGGSRRSGRRSTPSTSG